MFDSHIGQKCSNKECGYQDYLPNRCSQCQQKFCFSCFQEHRCSSTKNQPVTQPKKSKKKNICAHKGCSANIIGPMGIVCPYCCQKTCVSHRHQHQDMCRGRVSSKKINNIEIKTEVKSKKSFCPWFWSK